MWCNSTCILEQKIEAILASMSSWGTTKELIFTVGTKNTTLERQTVSTHNIQSEGFEFAQMVSNCLSVFACLCVAVFPRHFWSHLIKPLKPQCVVGAQPSSPQNYIMVGSTSSIVHWGPCSWFYVVCIMEPRLIWDD